MELQTLRWFVSVADGRTVTETAERFHTTQPAVTRGLRRLAEQFDAPLTERDGRRLRLTFAGEIAARAA
ncbi:MAG: LysR family transcriptional regulator, partial [Solirubrobacteraceae bacterium]